MRREGLPSRAMSNVPRVRLAHIIMVEQQLEVGSTAVPPQPTAEAGIVAAIPDAKTSEKSPERPTQEPKEPSSQRDAAVLPEGN
jgi:hypothetical protein